MTLRSTSWRRQLRDGGVISASPNGGAAPGSNSPPSAAPLAAAVSSPCGEELLLSSSTAQVRRVGTRRGRAEPLATAAAAEGTELLHQQGGEARRGRRRRLGIGLPVGDGQFLVATFYLPENPFMHFDVEFGAVGLELVLQPNPNATAFLQKNIRPENTQNALGRPRPSPSPNACAHAIAEEFISCPLRPPGSSPFLLYWHEVTAEIALPGSNRSLLWLGSTSGAYPLLADLALLLYGTANFIAFLLQNMAVLCSAHAAASVNANFLVGRLPPNDRPVIYSRIPQYGNSLKRRNRHEQVKCFAKGSSLQGDIFLNFADPVPSVKPSRLLPTEDLAIFPNSVPEGIFSTIRLDNCDAFYVLELSTSREFSSSLVDKNSAILVSFIDVVGDSLLQRIPAIYSDQSARVKAEQSIPFQTGSLDVVFFKGSKLQRIKEIWIGLESGSWRLDSLSLKVIHGPLDAPKEIDAISGFNFSGLQYTFEKINTVLGEDGVSVAEVKPVAVNDLSGLSLSDLQEGQLSSKGAATIAKEVKEDGLKEYADLKQSLLLYDAAIVITGFSAFTLASKDNAAYSFLVGGIGGFLYLLLLQRSVDGLPVISSPSEVGAAQPSVSGFSGVRRPWLILSLVLVAGAVALKYGAGGDSFELTPTELFVGTAGFLANKVAVLLAAFKPMQMNSKSEDGSGGQT
ncbi:hypothetical protein EJB05_27879, partial [Eragrostis curvula]